MKWEENVRKVEPYVPGEQPKTSNIIKLNTNECPYPPAPGVAKAVAAFKSDDLRLYPDPAASALTDCLSKYYHVPADQIFVGVGSDDVLSMSFLTFFNSKEPVLFPDITYSFYDVWAELYRIPYKQIPLNADFTMNKEDYMVPNGGVIFPNPNAPTGVLENLENVEAIVKANPDVIVIVDEAYIDFSGEHASALPLIEKYENLLVVQTFSKSRAMAGLRVGFAFGSKKLIGYLNDAKFSFNSYTMNLPTLTLGVEAVKDITYFKETVAKIVKTRERVKTELKKLGFSFTDSRSNFIFASHERVPAKELFEALKQAGIFVRYFPKPRIDNYLRISIGTDAEMDTLLAELKKYINQK